ncbi:O-glucosyltransferase rumi homolog [Agrilus planipennis]|uniref:O-glucosyltransferase rumi homolog n=1 Tax=Agrilus planipennis TaxID=224129 RepID=A0A1W4XG66_AGRPL|nr:O-glucosyltransferase rumi homolog [Agrilus planipennis]
MFLKLLSYIFLLFLINKFIVLVKCIECSLEDNKKCTNGFENKYIEEANTKYSIIFKQIEEARKTFTTCNNTKCSCYASVIENDLKIFGDGIDKAMMEKVASKGTKYQIIDHHLYRDKNCMFPSRCSGIEHFIIKLLPKLPNMELIINTRDWPQIHKEYGIFGPVFSFSKTGDYHDIMYPTWSFWEGGPAISLYPRGIGRWDQHREEIGKVANETAWENKILKAFFRGSRTSQERDALIILSRENPELVDAKYTKNQAWKSDADTLYASPAEEVTFTEHCKYKYLFNFRGVAASFRFKHILLCKSVVFHVGHEWLEFFYSALKPWIHYVPVDSNSRKEDLKFLIEFMKKHDDVAKEIAQDGFKIIWNNLKMTDIVCYWRKLLLKYAKLLKYKVKKDPNLIRIS